MPSALKFPLILIAGFTPLFLTRNSARWLKALAWAWAWALVARYGAFGFLKNAPVFTKVDFACLYAAGLKLLKGLSPYGPTPPEILSQLAQRGLNFSYIPTNFYHPLLSALAAPLTLLPYPVAHGLYLSLELALLLLLLALASKRGFFRLHYLPGVALALVLWAPLRHNLYLGQINLFVVAALGGLFLLEYSPLKHGALLWGISLIKPTYFLAHASYLKRKFLGALGVWVVTWLLASAALFPLMGDYFLTLLKASAHPILHREFNFSAYGLLSPSLGSGWAWAAHWALAAASVGLWLWAFWRRPLRERLAASIPASLLVVPVLVRYNLVALLWPGLLLWQRGGAPARLLLAGLWLLSNLNLPHQAEGFLVNLTLFSALLWWAKKG